MAKTKAGFFVLKMISSFVSPPSVSLCLSVCLSLSLSLSLNPFNLVQAAVGCVVTASDIYERSWGFHVGHQTEHKPLKIMIILCTLNIISALHDFWIRRRYWKEKLGPKYCINGSILLPVVQLFSAAIAQWIHLCLRPTAPRLSPKHNI